MTTLLSGGVVDGCTVWEQKLGNVMWGFEGTIGGSEEGKREINWR